MSGPSFEIKQHGTAKAVSDLAKLGERGSDIRRVSEKVRSVYRKAEERTFDQSGPGWPPLADTTRDRKLREGLDPRPLRATGALYRALTAARAAGQIDIREPTEFRFGTTLPYARFHDSGEGVPQRKPIQLTVAERRQIEQLISAFIAREQT